MRRERWVFGFCWSDYTWPARLSILRWALIERIERLIGRDTDPAEKERIMSGLGSTPRNESVSEVWVKFCDDVMLTVFDGIPNDVMAKAKYVPVLKQWEWRSPEGARMRLVREPLYSVRQGRDT